MLPYTVTVQSTQGTQPINVLVSPHPDTRAIVILNDSAFDIDAVLSGSNQHCPVVPGIGDAFLVKSGFSGTVQLNVNPYFAQAVQNGALANVVKIFTYAHDEPLTQALMKGLQTSYPLSVPRLFGIGGGALSTLSNETNLFNPPTYPATKVIDIGFPGHTDLIDLYNNGVETHSVFDNVHNLTAQTFKTNALPPYLEAVAQMQVDAGIIFAAGTNNGVLSRIAFGSAACTAGVANTQTHNLGVVPSCILIVPQGGALSPAATGYQVGNSPTTTTFDIHTNTNLTFYWLAIA